MILDSGNISVNSIEAVSDIIVSQKMEFEKISPPKKAIDYSHLRKNEEETEDEFVPIEDFVKTVSKEEINLYPEEDPAEPQSLLYAYIANKVSAYKLMISESSNHNIQDYI